MIEKRQSKRGISASRKEQRGSKNSAKGKYGNENKIYESFGVFHRFFIGRTGNRCVNLLFFFYFIKIGIKNITKLGRCSHRSMIREYTDGELANRIMRFIICLHRKEMQTVRNMCDPKVMWKFGSSYSDSIYSTMLIDMLWQRIKYSDIIRFFNVEIQIRKFNTDNIVATGVYRVDSKADSGSEQNYFEYTVVMAEGLVVFVQLNEKDTPPKIHRVVAVNEAVYNFEETILVYIESIKDHIVWHYGDKRVESIDTLKRLEQELSGDFIRVHRSYIVNKRKVSSIQRCSVTMTNGDNIPIPYKKYVEVREKLIYKNNI